MKVYVWCWEIVFDLVVIAVAQILGNMSQVVMFHSLQLDYGKRNTSGAKLGNTHMHTYTHTPAFILVPWNVFQS